MSRAYNFSPGPAALPEPALRQAQRELLDWGGRGLSVMEISHRSGDFMALAAQTEADCRDLLGISEEYAVLFTHGGASMQFSAVPLNLAGVIWGEKRQQVDYVCTGSWSGKAIAEARQFADVQVVASGEPGFSQIPPVASWQLSGNAAYLHYTSNETIHGVEFNWIPEVEAPLVADMSSNILSRPLAVDRFGVIYAGAQKNIGPAGLGLVIVRKDLLERAKHQVPAVLDWQVQAQAGSMYNTPPTFAWYFTGLVFKWLKAEGGLAAMAEQNQRKADKLFACIERSNFYHCPVAPDCRSRMNIPFTLADADLDAPFLQAATDHGLLNLKGHRSVGGMRASLYNAVPEAAVDALVAFMRDFESVHG